MTAINKTKVFLLIVCITTGLSANIAAMPSATQDNVASQYMSDALTGDITRVGAADGAAQTWDAGTTDTTVAASHTDSASQSADATPTHVDDTTDAKQANDVAHKNDVNNERLGALVREISGKHVDQVKKDVRADLRRQLEDHLDDRVEQKLQQYGNKHSKDRKELRNWIKQEYGQPVQSHDEIRERLKQVEDGTLGKQKAKQRIRELVTQQNKELLKNLDQSNAQRYARQKKELKQWLNGQIPADRYDELEDRLTALEQKQAKQDKQQGKQKEALKQWIKSELPENRHDEFEHRFSELEQRINALEQQKQSPGHSKKGMKDWVDTRDAHILKEAKQYTDKQTKQQKQNRKDINRLAKQLDALHNLSVKLDAFKNWIQQQDAATLKKSKAYTDHRESALKDWVNQQLDAHDGTKGSVPKHAHHAYAPKDHDHPKYVTQDDLSQWEHGAASNTTAVDEALIVDQVKQYVDSRISNVQSGITKQMLRHELIAFRDWAENRYATKEDMVKLARQNEQLRREVAYLKEAVNQTELDTDTAAQVMAAHNYTELHYGESRCKVREHWNGDKIVQCVR